MQVEQLDIGRKPDGVTPDWTQIKIDFEAGEVSVREIARRHGVSDTAVHKRARTESWIGLHSPQTDGANHEAPPPQTTVQTKSVRADEYARHYACMAHPKPEDDFEWKPENDAVLLTDRPAIAVYLNKWNQIVLRAEAAWNEDSDPCIWIDRHDVPALIRRLQELSHGAA